MQHKTTRHERHGGPRPIMDMEELKRLLDEAMTKRIAWQAELNEVLTREEAMRLTGHKSVASFYAAMAQGDVPRPINVGIRSKGWLLRELLERQRRKIAERDARLAAEAKAKAKAKAEAEAMAKAEAESRGKAA